MHCTKLSAPQINPSFLHSGLDQVEGLLFFFAVAGRPGEDGAESAVVGNQAGATAKAGQEVRLRSRTGRKK